MQLFHGSSRIIPSPTFGLGNPHNDYGLGFYCTQSKDLACEWACPGEEDGYANQYELEESGLSLIDLGSEDYSTLNWLAILVENRIFDATTPLMAEAMNMMRDLYLPNLNDVDIIKGYRADDSYFSFARAFLDNRISLDQLERAMRLGHLGEQVTIRSLYAFDALRFSKAFPAESRIWHGRRAERDRKARLVYKKILNESPPLEGTYVLDLLRRS